MPELLSHLLSGGLAGTIVALAIYLGPKLIELVKAHSQNATEVAVTTAREETARRRIEAKEAARTDGVLERLHGDCREELDAMRLTVDDCQRKHAESEARATAMEAVVAELRGVVSWMRRELAELRRDSQRPEQEPAE